MESVKQPAPQSSPPERGWFKRNWKRLIGGLLLLLMVGAVGWYLAKFGPIMFSRPYREALDFAVVNPKVIAELGEPVKRGLHDWTPAGTITDDGENGDAHLEFSITGSKRQAKVSIVARKVKGDKEWGFPTFKVTPLDGAPINLADEINKTKPDDTPKANEGAVKPATTTEASKEQNINIDVDLPDQDKNKK
jgi:hypothetical protein